MKNTLRQTLLSNNNDNSIAMRAVEIIERLSVSDLNHLMLKHLYKDTSLPYDYVRTQGLITVVQTEERLSLLNTLPNSEEITKWILDYSKSTNEIGTIDFDTMYIDRFLSFANIFNPTLYDDINALLSFADEKHAQEFSRKVFGKPDIFKHMTVQDLQSNIAMLNEDGVVLEVQKKNRALFYNILYLNPDYTLVCHKTLKGLTERRPEWFEYSVVTKKAENYAQLVAEFPIEIKAFEEILAGERRPYIRTEEPDYTTPPLRTYEFTQTTYCALTAEGEKIHNELKEALAHTIPSAYKFKRPGLLKTDMEEVRKASSYDKILEELHGHQVECVAEKVFVEKLLPDCAVLRCKNVSIRPISGWEQKEARFNTFEVAVDTNVALDMIKRIHYYAVKFGGTIEFSNTNEGVALALQVNNITVMG